MYTDPKSYRYYMKNEDFSQKRGLREILLLSDPRITLFQLYRISFIANHPSHFAYHISLSQSPYRRSPITYSFAILKNDFSLPVILGLGCKHFGIDTIFKSYKLIMGAVFFNRAFREYRNSVTEFTA